MTTVGLALFATALVLFYTISLNGWTHAKESFARWRIEHFGGVHEVDRSVQIYDVLLSFQPEPLDRLDVVSLFSNHVGGRTFEKELEDVVKRGGGQVRVVTLDPRMGSPDHPRYAEFAALGEAFGQEPWLFAANVRHSAATLVALEARLGDGFEVRFTQEGLPDANPPFLTYGRSAQMYFAEKPSRRLDVIVPRPDSPDGVDSLAHPAFVIRDRPDHPMVVKYKTAFETLWESGIRLDEELTTALIATFDG